MKNDSRRSSLIVIPRKVVAGIVIGIVVFISSYIFSHYAGASAVQNQVLPLSSGNGSVLQQGSQWQPQDKHAHLMVYRSHSPVLPFAKSLLNLFVNDRYHTSLLPQDSAVEVALCPGKKSINLSTGPHNRHHNAQPETSASISPILRSGEHYYYQVTLDGQGKILTRWVPQQEARTALANLKLQKRTLSRIINEHECPETSYSIDSTKIYVSQQDHSLESSLKERIRWQRKN